MLRVVFGVASLLLAAAGTPVFAQQVAPSLNASSLPFSVTLSNNTPLAFGIRASDAARVLDTPLTYVSGRPGDEIFLAIRDISGSGFFSRSDRLYLQFRGGRLAGWKGDWGNRWMWQ
jgi:hypothetical protein